MTVVTAAGVLGLGTALPTTTIENATIERQLDLPAGWIEQRTGIQRRRQLAAGETLTALASAAASSAIADAGISSAEIDLVLAATTGADEIIPNLAPLIAGTLGLRSAAYDVGMACSGFLAGMQVAVSTIESGRARTVLLVGADAMRRWTDPAEGSTAAVFGDGAGAVVVSAAGSGEIGAIELGSDATGCEAVWIDRASGRFRMDGHETYRRAVTALRTATESLLERAGLAADDIDLFVYHQANRRILASLSKRLDVPSERVVDAIAEVGNTSAASIPLALAHARATGRLHAGSRVLVGAAGSGFCFGAGLLTW